MEEQTVWQTRAAAWELLALSLRYPELLLAEVVASGEWAEAARELVEACGGEWIEACASELEVYRGAEPEALLHALRTEATRLFIGAPMPAVSPYEGVFRAQCNGRRALLYVNEHAMAVERFMKACGLGHPEGKNDPIDHVATECEFLQYLAALEAGIAEPAGAVAPADFPGGSARAAHESFMEQHARAWMPAFAEAAAQAAREPFFKAAACVLEQIAH